MDRRNFLAMGGVAAVTGPGIATPTVAPRSPRPRDKLLMRRIPSSGETIPAIGLGTSGPFEVGSDEAARAPLREVLQGFFAGGGTLIDTSPMYSTAEAVLGDLLTPTSRPKPSSPRRCGRRVRAGTANKRASSRCSVPWRCCGTSAIELMQVHNLVDLDVHLKTLRRWKAEGKIKYVGVTHYTTSSYPDLIAIIEREKLDFVQFNYSVTTREAEKRLLPLCADKGVAVLVNRAFEDGNLFSQVQGRPLPAWAAEFGAKSWAQVFLKFVLAHPAVTCVIPATGKLRNLVDNLAAGTGALPDAKQRAQIIAEF